MANLPPKTYGTPDVKENEDGKEQNVPPMTSTIANRSRYKWKSTIETVKTTQSTIKKFKPSPDEDPFLQRFTVTDRGEIDDIEHEFNEIFTTKFWRTLVMNPANPPFYWWSCVVACAVMYNLIFVILRGCFWHKLQTPDVVPCWYFPDYFCDVIYILDMYIKSRVGFLEQGLLCRDIKRITMVYIKSWMFVVDVICIAPLDLLYLTVGFNAFLRFNKCLKIWRMREFFNLAETHANNPNLFRVVNLILIIVVIIHWNGCLYFAISRTLGFGSDEWVYPDIYRQEFSSFWKQYAYCFYWSTLTLTTIGDTAYPQHTAAYVYCTTCSLVGVLIFATIFGNVGALINEMDAARNDFQHKVDAVKRYMVNRQVYGPVQERVINWFDYTWNNKESVDDSKHLDYLPEKLRAEICIHVHLKTLRKVEIFKDCEPGVLVELVLKLKLQVFSPGDYICRKGDIGRDMYIVKRGKLQVCSEDGKVVFVTLSDGAVFGEISVLNIPGNKTGNRRTASVRSVGYSDLFSLSKYDLMEALREFPEARMSLLEQGKKMLKKDKLFDEELARRQERLEQKLDKKIEMMSDAVEDLQRVVKILIEKLSSSEEPRKPRSPDDEVKSMSEEPRKPRSPDDEVKSMSDEPRKPRSPDDEVKSMSDEPRKPRSPDDEVESIWKTPASSFYSLTTKESLHGEKTPEQRDSVTENELERPASAREDRKLSKQNSRESDIDQVKDEKTSTTGDVDLK